MQKGDRQIKGLAVKEVILKVDFSSQTSSTHQTFVETKQKESGRYHLFQFKLLLLLSAIDHQGAIKPALI